MPPFRVAPIHRNVPAYSAIVGSSTRQQPQRALLRASNSPPPTLTTSAMTCLLGGVRKTTILFEPVNYDSLRISAMQRSPYFTIYILMAFSPMQAQTLTCRPMARSPRGTSFLATLLAARLQAEKTLPPTITTVGTPGRFLPRRVAFLDANAVFSPAALQYNARTHIHTQSRV